MQQTRSKTLRQAKTGKHECRNITATNKTYIQWQDFNSLKKSCKFLASYGVIIQSITQSFLKTSVCGTSLTHGIWSIQIFFLRVLFNLFLDQPSYFFIYFIYFVFSLHYFRGFRIINSQPTNNQSTKT